jgi:hypothetical protein
LAARPPVSRTPRLITRPLSSFADALSSWGIAPVACLRTVCDLFPDGQAFWLAINPDQQLDVLFTDIRLGGALNGWDVAEIFRDRFPNIRVIYASGYSIEPRRDVMGSEFFK